MLATLFVVRQTHEDRPLCIFEKRGDLCDSSLVERWPFLCDCRPGYVFGFGPQEMMLLNRGSLICDISGCFFFLAAVAKQFLTSLRFRWLPDSWAGYLLGHRLARPGRQTLTHKKQNTNKHHKRCIPR